MRKKVITTFVSILAIVFLIGAGLVYYLFSRSTTGYHKDGSKVFYKVYGISNSEVMGADAKSFKTMAIGDGQLGADKDRIYLMQSAFPSNLDKASFQLLPNNQNWKRFFTRDKSRIYYANSALDGVDPNSFVILEDGFSKDSSSAFYQETKLADVNAATFRSLGSYYATDGKLVFYSKTKIEGADAATFKVSADDDYAHDKNNSYSFEVPGKIVDGEFVPNK